MDEIKLKPCPFAGEKRGRSEFLSNEYLDQCGSWLTRKWEFGVGCLACSIALQKTTYSFSVQMTKDGGIEFIEDDRQEAADTWNRRAEHG